MSCCGGADLADKISTEVSPAGLDARREGEILAASHRTEDGAIQTDFLVPGMHCHSCIRTLERGLGSLKFVSAARANLSTKRVSVVWTPGGDRARNLEDTFGQLGFEARLFDLEIDDKSDPVGRELLTSLGIAGFAAANIMLLSVSVWSGASAETAQLFHLISGLIAVPTVFFAGRPFFRSAWLALSVRRLNMDVPISLAIVLALGMSIYEALVGGEESYFDASVTLLFFLLIGRTLDHYMRQRARGAVSRLQHMAAKGANRIIAGGQIDYVPLKEIEIGDTLLVAAGERVPLDGIVEKGSSDLDWSLVNGESEPVQAKPGQDLYAGVMNLTGAIEMRATRKADKSFISEIIQLMSHAEQGKAKYRRIADRLAEIYAPAVHLIAAITFLGWFIASGDWQSSLYIAITTLIITCPCALGLAVPIVHVVASGRLFDAGVLVKDGAALEKLNEINTVVFDKTGTLTLGTPKIVNLPAMTERQKAIIRALAAGSSHPASKALCDQLGTGGSEAIVLEQLREDAGNGLEAVHQGKQVRLGRSEWVFDIASEIFNDVDASQSRLSFAIEGEPLLNFGYADALRDDAAETIAALKSQGFDLQILSGDREDVVQAMARDIGVETALAAQTPQQKISHIRRLQDSGKRVLYVGDGLNDAPALAAAHASMAPASASDVGQLAADLVFTSKGLHTVYESLNVAHKTDRLVKQNFGLALAYNAVAIPLSMAGFVTPLIAAIAMSSSSVLVVANSLRLALKRRRMTKDNPTTPGYRPIPAS